MADTMSNNLEGKVAVITGASRGLGKAMALALAGAGVKLALVARDREKLEETAKAVAALGVSAQIFIADVTDEAQVATMAELVVSQFGRVDILINNAGVNIRKPLVEYTLEEWRKITDTNLTSVFLMCRAMIPHMKGRGYGRILNMTSIMSHVSLPGRTAYSASKAGLLGLTRSLSQELAPEGITVVGISPGPFATEMNTILMSNPEANAQFMSNTPLNRWGKVEEIGNLALFLCGEGGAYITGTDILIDGGWTAR